MFTYCINIPYYPGLVSSCRLYCAVAPPPAGAAEAAGGGGGGGRGGVAVGDGELEGEAEDVRHPEDHHGPNGSAKLGPTANFPSK